MTILALLLLSRVFNFQGLFLRSFPYESPELKVNSFNAEDYTMNSFFQDD